MATFPTGTARRREDKQMITIIFMAVVVGLVAGFCYVIENMEEKKEVFKGISLACFAGAFVAFVAFLVL